MSRVPLSLLPQIEKLDGSDSQSFSPASRNPQDRPTEIEFSTKWGTGFEDLSFSLRRNLRQAAPDGLLRNVKLMGAGGFVASEGRYGGAPRDDNGVKVSAPGWFVGLKDIPFEEIYEDRDVSKWGPIPIERKAGLLTNNFKPADGQADGASIRLQLEQPTWSSVGKPYTSVAYRTPAGTYIGKVTADLDRTVNANTHWDKTNANFTLTIVLSDDEILSDYDVTTDQAGSVPVTGLELEATVGDRRFAFIDALYETTFATDDSIERAILASNVAVTGTHGITSLTASNVIRNMLSRAAPVITYDDNSIQETSFVFEQLVMEPGSTVESGIAEVNKVHLWVPMVWEGRKLHYGPPRPVDDYDWELSTYRGDSLIPTGQQASEIGPFNGVRVVFQDVEDGNRESFVGPLGDSAPWDTNGDASLRDTDESNPCNAEGQIIIATLKCDRPINRAIAIALGVVYMREHKIPPSSGQGRTQGWVKDRTGAWQPAYKVRAGDRVKYADHDQIYRVFGTRYTDSTKSLDLTYDSLPHTIDALFERLGVALAAVNAT